MSNTKLSIPSKCQHRYLTLDGDEWSTSTWQEVPSHPNGQNASKHLSHYSLCELMICIILFENLKVCSGTQEIPCISSTLKVHYQVHNNLPPALIMSQMNPVLTISPILIYTLTIWELSSLQVSQPKFCMQPSSLQHALHVTPISSSFIWLLKSLWGVQTMELLCMHSPQHRVLKCP
jgi:hypothetical protein